MLMATCAVVVSLLTPEPPLLMVRDGGGRGRGQPGRADQQEPGAGQAEAQRRVEHLR